MRLNGSGGTSGFRGYGIEGMTLVASILIATVTAITSMVTEPYDTVGRFSDDRIAPKPVSSSQLIDGEGSS